MLSLSNTRAVLLLARHEPFCFHPGGCELPRTENHSINTSSLYKANAFMPKQPHPDHKRARTTIPSRQRGAPTLSSPPPPPVLQPAAGLTRGNPTRWHPIPSALCSPPLFSSPFLRQLSPRCPQTSFRSAGLRMRGGSRTLCPGCPQGEG